MGQLAKKTSELSKRTKVERTNERSEGKINNENESGEGKRAASQEEGKNRSEGK